MADGENNGGAQSPLMTSLWPETTLQQIEGADWGDPPGNATRLVRRCLNLRRKPLGGFDAEDLRVMIGQDIGLEILVPMALDLLHEDPLIEGDLYPGDLLSGVLGVPDAYWAAQPTEDARLRNAVDTLRISDGRTAGSWPSGPFFAERLRRARTRWDDLP